MMMFHYRARKTSTDGQEGSILISVLGLIVVLSILSITLLTITYGNLFIVSYNVRSAKALNIAEAGIQYYLWHMTHNGDDFKDGHDWPATPDPQLGYGPYVHQYVGSSGKVQGTFTLWIQPKGKGSTVATVRSIGQVGTSGAKRVVEAKIGAASFASYGLVADVEFWFGRHEVARGPVFSNVGVHMDGKNTDTVGSANATYVPAPAYGGDGTTVHNGVWCDSSVENPVDCDTRDKSSWNFPLPSIDFNQVKTSLCNMKKVAFRGDPATDSIADQANACEQTPSTRTAGYIPRVNNFYQETVGYLIELNPDGTYDLSRVLDENDRHNTYASALTLQPIETNIDVPDDGVIYVEDNVWVRTDPKFHGRATIAAGRLASNSEAADINIAGEVLYTTKNGEDAIGLVAEDDVIVKPYAPPPPSSGAFEFEIDAAVLAQNGSVTWPIAYQAAPWACTQGWVDDDQTFIFYGSVATRQSWTWVWLVGSACGDAQFDTDYGAHISGFSNTVTQYDYDLLYAPPPSYPITGSYQILSWREVLHNP